MKLNVVRKFPSVLWWHKLFTTLKVAVTYMVCVQWLVLFHLFMFFITNVASGRPFFKIQDMTLLDTWTCIISWLFLYNYKKKQQPKNHFFERWCSQPCYWTSLFQIQNIDKQCLKVINWWFKDTNWYTGAVCILTLLKHISK